MNQRALIEAILADDPELQFMYHDNALAMGLLHNLVKEVIPMMVLGLKARAEKYDAETQKILEQLMTAPLSPIVLETLDS